MYTILSKPIEDKKIVWFSKTNNYAVVNSDAFEIITKILKKEPKPSLLQWIRLNFDLSSINEEEILSQFTILVNDNLKEKDYQESNQKQAFYNPKFFLDKNYTINSVGFYIGYQSEYVFSKFHPLFAHLESSMNLNHKQRHSYKVLDINNSIKLLKVHDHSKIICQKKQLHYLIIEFNNRNYTLKNIEIIGEWDYSEVHLFQGKFSMQILNDIYSKNDNQWMGVFHASAVSDSKNTILFLGDSGNGKSTSLAILNASGFNCVADDFVPIDTNKNVYCYPAAISVKEKSWAALKNYCPELENLSIHHIKGLDKKVKYIPTNNMDYSKQYKCKALVFIKYNPNVEIEIKEVPKIKAFEKLVPDSWISPTQNNAESFMSWFLELPCYQINYSNNDKMIKEVSKLFDNEL